MGRTRVKPHVQSVRQFVVNIDFARVQQFGFVQFEPSFYAFLLNALGNDFHKFSTLRVQFAGFFVGKEGHRHTPVALA